MPGYISHTVMARDVYKRINNINISEKYMITYSLGGDLCKYSKCRYASHHYDMEKFIYNMADYIKANNLCKDGEMLGILYGHICHYIMDNTIHPLVRAIDKKCIYSKKNHTMIELYYDSYLVKSIFNTRIDKYNDKLLTIKINNEAKKIIDNVYKLTYNVNNISKYYAFNLWLYRNINLIYKIFGYNLLRKISGINKFLAINKDIDLLNENNEITYKNYKHEMCHDDLLTQYNESIKRAIAYINDINKYLNI